MSKSQQPRYESIEEVRAAKRLSYRLLKLLMQKEFYSQATQEIFVLQMLAQKKSGFYLEIGSGHPIDSNNTFYLETLYSWNGISIDIDNSLVAVYNARRKNQAQIGDAATFDYSGHLSSRQSSNQIDYLSLDVDPAENSYDVLTKLPHDIYRFSVITFEHNLYNEGQKYANASRKFLMELGYELVVSNVKVFGKPFEDWWIDPKIVPEKIWTSFRRQDIEFADLWIQHSGKEFEAQSYGKTS